MAALILIYNNNKVYLNVFVVSLKLKTLQNNECLNLRYLYLRVFLVRGFKEFTTNWHICHCFTVQN